MKIQSGKSGKNALDINRSDGSFGNESARILMRLSALWARVIGCRQEKSGRNAVNMP